MSQEKNERVVGKVVGGAVGVAASIAALPVIMLGGKRGGGEVVKAIVKGCATAGDYVEREIRGDKK